MARRFLLTLLMIAALVLVALAAGGVGPGTSRAAAQGGAASGASAYTITDLGLLSGGTTSEANAINNAGDVVGITMGADGYDHAFLWHAGTMTDLSSIIGGYNSYARGINDNGQVAGIVYEGTEIRAFRYGNGTATILGLLPGGTAGQGFAINSTGVVVGYADTTGSNGYGVPTVWQASSATALAGLSCSGMILCGTGAANGINAAGQIVGDTYTGTQTYSTHATLWQNGTVTDLGAIDGRSGYFSSAAAINSAGQVIGYQNVADGGNHAMLWQNGTVTDLGTLGGPVSHATAINTVGQVVGLSATCSSCLGHAFVWQGGTISDLNTLIPADSGWELNEARGINDSGQIVGVGTFNGLPRAFLLDPANACALGVVAAPVVQALTERTVTGRIAWGSPELSGQGVEGATVRIGCHSTKTDSQGNYTLHITTPDDLGTGKGEVTLTVFNHPSGVMAVAKETFEVKDKDTQDTVGNFGNHVHLEGNFDHVQNQYLDVDNAHFTPDGFTITGAHLKLFPAPNDAPLSVDITYKKAGNTLKVHASSGLYQWGSQSVQLTSLDYQSPADTLKVAGTANLNLGGLALQNLTVSGERTGDTLNLVASGSASVSGATFDFTEISLIKQGGSSTFHAIGNVQLPNQKNPLAFDVMVQDGATTLDLALNQFDFYGSTISATLHYDSQAGLKVTGSGDTTIGGSRVTVTLDSAINPNKQTVDAKATLAFGQQGVATGVTLAYDGKAGTLGGSGSLVWKAKPCLSIGTGSTTENVITLGVTVSNNDVAVTGSGKFALPCEYGVGAVQLDVTYSGSYQAAQVKLPIAINGFKVDSTFRVENAAGEGRVFLGVSFPIDGLIKALTPPSGSQVRAFADPTVHILLTDPLGRRSGYDPASGAILNEIPDVAYRGLLNGVDAFTLPAFLGAYQVTLVSGTDVVVTLNVGGVPVDVTVRAGQPATVAAGATVGGDGAVSLVGKVVPAYPDVPTSDVAYEAITELAARGIIRGYEDGTFGPGDHTLRAQMAALIARALGWDQEDWGNGFPDRGPVDAALWRNVGTLAHYNVARGYPDGNGGFYYDPTGEVLHAQVISFITRAMVTTGRWQQQAADPGLYGGVLNGSGHEADVATYIHYAGALPDFPTSGAFAGWDQPSTRAWFARALWQALQATP